MGAVAIRTQAAFANDNAKPKGDPWVPLMAAMAPFPEVVGLAWRKRSEGMSVDRFIELSIIALTGSAN